MRTSSPNSSHCSKRLLAGTERSDEELLFGWHDRIEVSDQFLHADRAQRQWTWKFCSLFSIYVCAFNVTMRCRLALHPVLKAVDIDFPARAKAASTLSRSWRLRWRTWITCDVKRERDRESSEKFGKVHKCQRLRVGFETIAGCFHSDLHTLRSRVHAEMGEELANVDEWLGQDHTLRCPRRANCPMRHPFRWPKRNKSKQNKPLIPRINYVSIYLSIDRSIYVSIYLSIYLTIYLSIYLHE